MKAIKIGVAGVGSMGANHCRVLSIMKHVDFSGVFDINKEKCRQIAEKYQVVSFSTFNDLLSAVDAVIIAVPTTDHYRLTKQAIEQDKHVLVEKPFAASIEEAARIIEMLQNKKLVLQVGHIERFNPAVEQLQKIINRQEVISIETRRLGAVERNMDVDVVLDLMIHDIDIVLNLADSSISSIAAMGVSLDAGRLPDAATALISFKNGVIANLTANRISQEKIRTLSITETQRLINTNYISRELNVYYKTRSKLDSNLAYRTESIMEKILVPFAEPLYAEINHFVHCIHSGQPSRVGACEGVKALEVARQIKKSMEMLSPPVSKWSDRNEKNKGQK